MIQNIFTENKVIICVGSGGVGKTTISATLGLLAARQGLRVLVMTIDPSQRLKVALQLNDTDTTIKRISLPGFKGELHALLLDAEKIFFDFVSGGARKNSAHKNIGAERLFKNRLYQQLSTTLSGSQEFTSLLQLSKIVNTAEFDLVI